MEKLNEKHKNTTKLQKLFFSKQRSNRSNTAKILSGNWMLWRAATQTIVLSCINVSNKQSHVHLNNMNETTFASSQLN